MLLRVILTSLLSAASVYAASFPDALRYATAASEYSGVTLHPLMQLTGWPAITIDRERRHLSSMRTHINMQAAAQGIAPALVTAVMRAESGGDPDAVSSAGAVGLMQLMPETAERFGVSSDERRDPLKSVIGGVCYLGWLWRRFDGDLRKTIAAYNCGEGCVERHGLGRLPQETKAYLKTVLRYLRG